MRRASCDVDAIRNSDIGKVRIVKIQRRRAVGEEDREYAKRNRARRRQCARQDKRLYDRQVRRAARQNADHRGRVEEGRIHRSVRESGCHTPIRPTYLWRPVCALCLRVGMKPQGRKFGRSIQNCRVDHASCHAMWQTVGARDCDRRSDQRAISDLCGAEEMIWFIWDLEGRHIPHKERCCHDAVEHEGRRQQARDAVIAIGAVPIASCRIRFCNLIVYHLVYCRTYFKTIRRQGTSPWSRRHLL